MVTTPAASSVIHRGSNCAVRRSIVALIRLLWTSRAYGSQRPARRQRRRRRTRGRARGRSDRAELASRAGAADGAPIDDNGRRTEPRADLVVRREREDAAATEPLVTRGRRPARRRARRRGGNGRRGSFTVRQATTSVTVAPRARSVAGSADPRARRARTRTGRPGRTGSSAARLAPLRSVGRMVVRAGCGEHGPRRLADCGPGEPAGGQVEPTQRRHDGIGPVRARDHHPLARLCLGQGEVQRRAGRRWDDYRRDVRGIDPGRSSASSDGPACASGRSVSTLGRSRSATTGAPGVPPAPVIGGGRAAPATRSARRGCERASGRGTHDRSAAAMTSSASTVEATERADRRAAAAAVPLSSAARPHRSARGGSSSRATASIASVSSPDWTARLPCPGAAEPAMRAGSRRSIGAPSRARPARQARGHRRRRGRAWPAACRRCRGAARCRDPAGRPAGTRPGAGCRFPRARAGQRREGRPGTRHTSASRGSSRGG